MQTFTQFQQNIFSAEKSAFLKIAAQVFEAGAFLTREIFSFKNHAENEAGRLVPDLLLLFEKTLFEVNPSRLQLSFNQF